MHLPVKKKWMLTALATMGTTPGGMTFQWSDAPFLFGSTR